MSFIQKKGTYFDRDKMTLEEGRKMPYCTRRRCRHPFVDHGRFGCLDCGEQDLVHAGEGMYCAGYLNPKDKGISDSEIIKRLEEFKDFYGVEDDEVMFDELDKLIEAVKKRKVLK